MRHPNIFLQTKYIYLSVRFIFRLIENSDTELIEYPFGEVLTQTNCTWTKREGESRAGQAN